MRDYEFERFKSGIVNITGFQIINESHANTLKLNSEFKEFLIQHLPPETEIPDVITVSD